MEDAKVHSRKYKQMEDWLKGAVNLKYRDLFNDLRDQAGKDTGIVHVKEDGFVISEEVPKKVTWDQDTLEELALELSVEGEDPAEYIEANLTVQERKYKAWPQSIQSKFDKARTLIPQRPRISIKQEG